MEKGKVLIAETNYGKGYVFAIGDPWIYNEYIDHDRLPSGVENRKAAENLTGFLLGKVPPIPKAPDSYRDGTLKGAK